MTQTDEKAKALKHVREVCPELMENIKRKSVIEKMVDRFLGWNIPADKVYPDGGFSFKQIENHQPSGTNIFDATVAEEMFRYATENEVGEPIIGHTPHLEHWMIAIAKKTHFMTHTLESNIIAIMGTHSKDCARYDTTKEGDNQSPEFYQAYNNITS